MMIIFPDPAIFQYVLYIFGKNERRGPKKYKYMITDIRLRSQQLVNPAFDDPKELVAWMGPVK